MALREVDVRAPRPERLESLIGPERAQQFESTASAARALLQGRSVLNVNSTATGGGVAELLQTLLAYARGAGVDARWVVIEGDPRFFEITKRVHNHLYGTPGDGGPLGSAERRDYEETLERNVARLARPRATPVTSSCCMTRRPQASPPRCSEPARTWCGAAMSASIRRTSTPSAGGIPAALCRRRRWLRLLVRAVRAQLGATTAPCRHSRRRSTRSRPRTNRSMTRPSCGCSSTSGCSAATATEPTGSFTRRDGSRGRITRRVDLLGTGPPPPADAPVVLQASRWDALKDMRGVLMGFADTRRRPHRRASDPCRPASKRRRRRPRGQSGAA